LIIDASYQDGVPLATHVAEGININDNLERLKDRFQMISQLTSLLRRTVLEIDAVMNAQLTEIIEARPFQDLESRWSGLASVVWAANKAPMLKIKLLDLNWNELSRDLHYNNEIRRSILYRLLGQNELDTLGGEPFGIAMIDHGLSTSLDTEFDDLYTAQLICSMGEACMCPIIMSFSDDFFGETDAAWFTDLERVSKVLNGEDYRDWQALRELPNARFLGIVLSKTQLRGRYQDREMGFLFHQWPSQSDGLWATGCYDFLRTVIAEYNRCAWFGFLKLVTNQAGMGAVLSPSLHPLPVGCERNERANIRMTRNLAHAYSENGLIAIAESTKNNLLYFVGNRTVTNCNGSSQTEVVTQLQSVMVACRIVHYVKVKIRSLIGQVKTAAECEVTLNNWFDAYISPSSSSTELQAKFPLRGARVRVSDSNSDAARFQCEVIVRPQYQIDNVLGEIVLKTDFGATNLAEPA
jgi:type VI secretion system protein ImpD